jgi:hypothetical protein
MLTEVEERAHVGKDRVDLHTNDALRDLGDSKADDLVTATDGYKRQLGTTMERPVSDLLKVMPCPLRSPLVLTTM